MKRYFAVSDVHSFFKEMLASLLEKGFDPNNKEHIVIICGDAFDRGDESLKMFEWMQDMCSNNRLIYVRGNHEDLLFHLVEEIIKGINISNHHFSNGTVKTIADMFGVTIYDILYKFEYYKIMKEKIKELTDFISNNSVDYFILDKTVFTHGWVPTTIDENRNVIVHENWRDGDWYDARWENGMEMFHKDLLPEDMNTIVCGHWHTSFGWHKYEHICSEWGDDAIFDTYIKEKHNKHIIAIDGCTAYTRHVNCVVFDSAGNILT